MAHIRESKRLKVIDRSYQGSGKFGQLTRDLGLVETDKIKKAMVEQQRIKHTGDQVPKLGRILVDKGYLEREAAIEVLTLQKRIWVQCPRCGSHVSRLAFKEQGQAQCRHCKTHIKGRSGQRRDKTEEMIKPASEKLECAKHYSTRTITAVNIQPVLEPVQQPQPIKPKQRIRRRRRSSLSFGALFYRIVVIAVLLIAAKWLISHLGITPDKLFGDLRF